MNELMNGIIITSFCPSAACRSSRCSCRGGSWKASSCPLNRACACSTDRGLSCWAAAAFGPAASFLCNRPPSFRCRPSCTKNWWPQKWLFGRWSAGSRAPSCLRSTDLGSICRVIVRSLPISTAAIVCLAFRFYAFSSLASPAFTPS